MAKLTGGGIQGNKNVNVGVRTGTGSKGSSPGAADQIGQSVAFKKDKIDGGPGFNPTKYGNEVALNSKSARARENDTRLRKPRYARLTSSRQFPSTERHSQFFRPGTKQRRLTGCCLENEKRPSASIRQWRTNRSKFMSELEKLKAQTQNSMIASLS